MLDRRDIFFISKKSSVTVMSAAHFYFKVGVCVCVCVCVFVLEREKDNQPATDVNA